MGHPQSNRAGGLWILGQHHTTCQPLRCDFCHPRLSTNRRGANSTSLTWRLPWSFQLTPTLTWQFISHCDIAFFSNFFISQVDEAFRGQGLGGLLISAAEDASRSLDATWFGTLTLQNAGKQCDTLLHFDCLTALVWGLKWSCTTTTLSVLEANATWTMPIVFFRSHSLSLLSWLIARIFLFDFIWYVLWPAYTSLLAISVGGAAGFEKYL